MSITILPSATDDPAFIALIEHIVARLDENHDPDEVFIIEIKNWFDHKWLKFSGIGKIPFNFPDSSHPQVALDEFFQEKITFPPFTPNRIVRQEWWAREKIKRGHLHYQKNKRQHSAWNLQRRVNQFASSALFVWLSSGTQTNDKASLMVYRVDGESVETWYASLHRDDGWKLNRTKGIERERIELLMAPIGEPRAITNTGSLDSSPA